QLLFAAFIIRRYAYPPPSERYLVFNASIYPVYPENSKPSPNFDAFVVGNDGRFGLFNIGSLDLI
ncbi:hypothetical protein HK100_002648, partial [Physocladia obscura]